MEYHNFSFGLELSGIPLHDRCFEYYGSDVEHFGDLHSEMPVSILLKAAYSIPIKRSHIEKNMKKVQDLAAPVLDKTKAVSNKVKAVSNKAKNKLGDYMVNTAERTFGEVDVILMSS